MKVKCNKCGYVGEKSEFKTGRDFMQNEYIAVCANPECDNRQSPGGASLRMMPGVEHPFVFVRDLPNDETLSPTEKVFRDASEAS